MEKFIQKSILAHGSKYDYSLVEYVNSTTKVKIICPSHGEFQQIPSGHVRGKGCVDCGVNKNKGTKKKFIKGAIEIHGDKYDYSLVEYKTCKIKVKIICKIHGVFEQNPNDHLSGQTDCPKCANDGMKLTQKEFIEKVVNIHGNKYDYSHVQYENYRSSITIICLIHGKFKQLASNHLQGHGCKKCKIDKLTKTKTKEEFVQKAQKIHENKYDYSSIVWKNTEDKVKIICLEHGEFEQLPNHHLIGQGCKRCAINKTKTTQDEFINEAMQIHGLKYDYSLVKYITRNIKVKIICKIHGEFEQKPCDHLDGSGCNKCSVDKQRSSKEEFIKEALKIHGNTYDYLLVEYKTNKTKVKIICKIHGIFEQKPNCHLSAGTECPHCYRESARRKTEGRVKEFLTKNSIKFEMQCSVDNKRFDFLINDDYVLEIDGRQHFPHLANQDKRIKTDKNDIEKMDSIIDYYPIVRLFQEHIWNNKYDWEKLLTSLKGLEPGTLYIRSDEKEIYKNHLLKYTIKYL